MIGLGVGGPAFPERPQRRCDGVARDRHPFQRRFVSKKDERGLTSINACDA